MKTLLDLDFYLDKAERSFLLSQEVNFSFALRVTQAIRSNLSQFEREIATHKGLVVTEYSDRKVNGVKLGVPSEIRFDSKLLLRRRPGLSAIRAAFEDARSAARTIDLAKFIEENFGESKRKFADIVSAVRAAEFLIENQKKIEGLYPRQIPHGQSTKLLIESTLVRRILAFHLGRPQLSTDEVCAIFGLRQKPSYFHFHATAVIYDGVSLSDHHSIITELNKDRFDLSLLEYLLVVENEETFHSVLGKIPNGMVILGNGRKAASLSFLKDIVSHLRIFYWGDIDKTGYEILSDVHEIFPKVCPIGMDMQTIDQFTHLKQSVPNERSIQQMTLLRSEYERVCAEGIQIEQEQLPVEEVLKLLIQHCC